VFVLPAQLAAQAARHSAVAAQSPQFRQSKSIRKFQLSLSLKYSYACFSFETENNSAASTCEPNPTSADSMSQRAAIRFPK
jgi:hypothetical protein